MTDQEKTAKLRARLLNALHIAGYDVLYAVACTLREHNIEVKTRDLLEPTGPRFTLDTEAKNA